MRLHGGSNHLLGVPTGLLQAWRADELASAYGGGVVRVECARPAPLNLLPPSHTPSPPFSLSTLPRYASSAHLNALYPGEITSLLAPRTRALLRLAGHATRQFNPKARRVLGAAIRQRMPRWEAGGGAPFVPFTVPALELRRLLAEARRAAAASNSTFELHYTRLAGARGDEAWRAGSRGVAVRLTRDDGRGGAKCVSRNETRAAAAKGAPPWARASRWTACAPDELAMLPEPSAWALKISLFYPYAIVPEAPRELVCNY